MRNIIIKQIRGDVIKLDLDEFYKRNDSNGTARATDLFFVAYDENIIVGCVRYCVEEGTSMLRTMRVDSSYHRQGIGRELLKEFARYLDKYNIRNVFCLPYPHLEAFYGMINFEAVEPKDVPQFLIDRAIDYAKDGLDTLYMRRL